MIAFLYKPFIDVHYLKWYNDSCSISSSIEYNRSLCLYCSTTTEQCTCLDNMCWNGSFSDRSNGMHYTDNSCHERLSFGKTCNPQIDSCMEYLMCSTTTNTCDCPLNSYYNQLTCNPKLPFNATQSCTLSRQCVTGIVCSSNVYICSTSQSWIGNNCSNSSTYGQYCLTTLQCNNSAQ